jgi:hypothetical protein
MTEYAWPDALHPAINELWDAIRNALPSFSPAECANYFTATRYEPN